MARGPAHFDWNHARAFLAVAEEGSLSAAAKVLGLSQPTVGRQITALEAELGVTLFERSGRSLVLAPAGRQLLVQVKLMASAANQLSLMASGQSQSVTGTVRITASDVLSAYVLPEVIGCIHEVAPALRVEIVASNEIQDLQRREADIAIRHVRPRKRELVARKLGIATAHIYAADSYLQRHGTPTSPKDLHSHQFVHVGDLKSGIRYLKAWGLPIDHQNFLVGSDNGLVSWELVQRGHGLLAMADYIGRRTPGLCRLDLGLAPIKFPVWLVTHRELHTSRKIRLVFDITAEQLVACGLVERASRP